MITCSFADDLIESKISVSLNTKKATPSNNPIDRPKINDGILRLRFINLP
jgi:hypothetical protein